MSIHGYLWNLSSPSGMWVLSHTCKLSKVVQDIQLAGYPAKSVSGATLKLPMPIFYKGFIFNIAAGEFFK